MSEQTYCTDCNVLIEGVESEDGRGVCDACWQKFGQEIREWLDDAPSIDEGMVTADVLRGPRGERG